MGAIVPRTGDAGQLANRVMGVGGAASVGGGYTRDIPNVVRHS
jgi:hypothetical protein